MLKWESEKIKSRRISMAYIQSYKEQSWLLPPSIEDLIPEDHICFLVEGLIDSLDYTNRKGGFKRIRPLFILISSG